MNRSIQNLMDAFAQHLASKNRQLRLLDESRSDPDEWLRSELASCLEYLRAVDKFGNLLRVGDDGQSQTFAPPLVPGRPELFIRGRRSNIWIRVSSQPAARDLGPLLERIENAVARLASLDEGDIKLLVAVVGSHGKWARRRIDECISQIQERAGIQFARHAPCLTLSFHADEEGSPGGPTILRLSYAFIGKH